MFFAIAGFLFGALLVVLFNENAERANELLKDTINNLEEDIDLLNSKIKNRDRMIEKQQKDNAILLDNAAELRVKIEDLENNIELLTNNLTDENKELISDSESEN
jgi:predicted RNase H-like nuclease (RuvC/YqgF family)